METSTVIASLLNFSVVLFVLVYFSRKPFGQFLLARSESVKKQIGEAEKLSLEANAALAKWESHWNLAQTHAKQNHIDAVESLKKFKEKAILEAKQESDRMKKEADLMSVGETVKAKKALQREAIERSVELAELYLGEHLPAQDKHKLVSEFVELVGHGTR
ncbi:MAG: ATP synthase F0 subunit B [Deltaproteobacteria bacterium]|nr:ATP synthase F0 subunit B [Deltaproteobacteria bacterium]